MHPDLQKNNSDPNIGDDAGTPKFGRLLLVLAAAVLLVVALTLASEAYYS